MTPFIPDRETRERLVEKLRETNRSLDIWNLELAEAIATVEADLRQQKRKRLGLTTDSKKV